MALSEQITEAVRAKVQAGAVLQGLQDLASTERVRVDTAALQSALKQASELITKGQYGPARDKLLDLHKQQGAVLNAELDRLIDRYSQLAERATAADDLGTAEQALRKAKALAELKL